MAGLPSALAAAAIHGLAGGSLLLFIPHPGARPFREPAAEPLGRGVCDRDHLAECSLNELLSNVGHVLDSSGCDGVRYGARFARGKLRPTRPSPAAQAGSGFGSWPAPAKRQAVSRTSASAPAWERQTGGAHSTRPAWRPASSPARECPVRPALRRNARRLGTYGDRVSGLSLARCSRAGAILRCPPV